MALNASLDPRRAGSRPGRRLLDNLWFAASSPQMTIALAVLLAFTVGLAASIPQLPAGLDAVASGVWLSTATARFGRFGAFLSSTGLFTLLGGPWATALLSVAAFHLALRVANQASRLIRRPTPDIPLPPQGLPFELVHSHTALPAMQSRIEDILVDDGQRRILHNDVDVLRPRTDAFTVQREWAAIGPLLTYVGLLLILGGLLWNTVDGWNASNVALMTGRIVRSSQAEGLALTLIDAGGAREERDAVLELSRGVATRNTWLGYGRPATWGSVWVAQRASGPALSVRAEANGRVLTLQSLQGGGETSDALHLRFDQNESEQGFNIPTRNLAFRVVSYESLPDPRITGPAFLIEGYRGDNTTPQLNELVEEAGAVSWEGVTLTLQRDRYVVVDLAAVPGLPALLAGGLILLAGAGVTAWAGMTRIWINAATDRNGTLVAVRAAVPATGQDPVARIAAALAGGGDNKTNEVPKGGFPISETSKVLRGAATVAVMLGGAILLAAYSVQAAATSAPTARMWAFALRNVLAGAGLAAWIPALTASFLWAVRSSAPNAAVDPLLPPDVQGMRGRTGDPGRAVALAGFPLLTAALLAGGVWNLLAFATPWRAGSSELWLLAAWFMGAAYLHATSGWRPLRLSAWLLVILAAATLATGLAAVLTAGSLLL